MAEFCPIHPPHWRALSAAVHFGRAEVRCERCGRCTGGAVLRRLLYQRD
jgi:ribosomal protein S14